MTLEKKAVVLSNKRTEIERKKVEKQSFLDANLKRKEIELQEKLNKYEMKELE